MCLHGGHVVHARAHACVLASSYAALAPKWWRVLVTCPTSCILVVDHTKLGCRKQQNYT